MQVEITSKNNYFLHQSLSVRFAGYPINQLIQQTYSKLCRCNLSRFLNGLVTLQRDAVQHASMAVVIVHRIVLGASIVPKCQGIRLPYQAAS